MPDFYASAVEFFVYVPFTNVAIIRAGTLIFYPKLDISFGVDTEGQVVANTYLGESFNGIDCVLQLLKVPGLFFLIASNLDHPR